MHPAESDPNDQDPGLFPVESVQPEERIKPESVQRAELMIAALDCYDEASKAQNLIYKFNKKDWLKAQQDNLGTDVTAKWRREQYEKRDTRLVQAKENFMQAIAVGRSAEAASDPAILEADERRFVEFESTFRGETDARMKKRERARQQSQDFIQAAMESANRAPEGAVRVIGSEVLKAVVLEPGLANTKDKLIGLRDDTRAGFLPTTHLEKNQAFELLDYLNVEKYPNGVNQRLDEIATHQQKVAQNPKYEHNLRGRQIYEFSQDAVRSVIQEWGDHLQSAVTSYEKLSALQTLLDSGVSPRISVAEAVDGEDGSYDYAELVRFINLKSLRDGEAREFDPLRTKEDRSVVHPYKNKIIEDVHTATGSPEEIREFIDTAAEQLNVKDGRVLLKEALLDQHKRRVFWYQVLRSVSEDGFKDKAEQALRDAGVPGYA